MSDLAKELFGTVNRATIRKFKEYNTARPEIYAHFKQYAFAMKKTGRKRYSAKCIMERIRWDFDMKYKSTEFKISNSFTSLYVRLLILREPEFRKFFQLKKVHGLSDLLFEKKDLS